MTALAFAGKCGFRGASGSVRSFAVASRARSEPRAIAPTPTPQSRKKCRRVRASVNALSISCGVMIRSPVGQVGERLTRRADFREQRQPKIKPEIQDDCEH